MKYPKSIGVLMNAWTIKVAVQVSETEYKLVDSSVKDAAHIVDNGIRDELNKYYNLLKDKASEAELEAQWKVCTHCVNAYNVGITSEVWLNKSAERAATFKNYNIIKTSYTDADVKTHIHQLADEFVQLIEHLDCMDVHDVEVASDDDLDAMVSLAADYGVEPVDFVKAAFSGETSRYYYTNITRAAKINCVLKAMILAQYEDEFLTKVEVPANEDTNGWISHRDLRVSGKTVSDFINVEYRDFEYDADDIINEDTLLYEDAMMYEDAALYEDNIFDEDDIINKNASLYENDTFGAETMHWYDDTLIYEDAMTYEDDLFNE